MRQISDEGRREIAKEIREQFYCCRHAEEFTEGLYDVLDLGHCEPTHGGYPDLAERLADYVEPAPVTGSTSDGYHTFDELYHHRAVLFSVVVAMFRGCSWKSVTCPACGMSNSIAWGSMDLPPFRQAVAMLADSWNSR